MVKGELVTTPFGPGEVVNPGDMLCLVKIPGHPPVKGNTDSVFWVWTSQIKPLVLT